MIVLDTNVISELGRPTPSRAVLEWFARANSDDLYLNDITLMELAYGAEKHALKHDSNRFHLTLDRLLRDVFNNRVVGSSVSTSLAAGYLRARVEMGGRQMSVQDAMIAAICLAQGATLATRNIKDFEGLDLALVNPFEGP